MTAVGYVEVEDDEAYRAIVLHFVGGDFAQGQRTVDITEQPMTRRSFAEGWRGDEV